MSTRAFDLIERHIDELADAMWDMAFATERACMAMRAVHAEIDSFLLSKTPFKEHWIKYTYQKTQGEDK